MNEPNSYKRFDSIQPLPRRAVPSADEDLLSIIRRSASRMGYEDLRWILRPEGDRWDIKEKEIPLLSKKEDFHVLQHLLLLSEEQLHSHTLHRFAPLLEKVQDDLSHGSEAHRSAKYSSPQFQRGTISSQLTLSRYVRYACGNKKVMIDSIGECN